MKKLIISIFWIANIFLLTSNNAFAECAPGADGPVATKHSAVKKPGDPVVISWVNPTQDSCGDLLEGETALTEVRLYVSVDSPVVEATPVAASYAPDQTSVGLTADAAKGADIYYALKACNAFGCSPFSNQEFVKLPGNPGAPGQNKPQ